MRKLLALLLAFALMGSLLSCAAAEDVKTYRSGDWEYTILNDNEVMIYMYNGLDTSVVIPDELDGKKVAGIGESGFLFSREMKSLTIPDSVYFIEKAPFLLCDELSEIIVSSNSPYYEVVDGVLFSKRDRQLVYYPQTKTATSYEIPQGTQSIGFYAFYNSTLSNVIIPDSITSIGSYAFPQCSAMTAITIPDTVVSIGDGAFYGSGLESITIPDSVTSIGANPFRSCDRLKEIYVSPDHPYLALIDGVLFSKPDKRLVCLPNALLLESYEIPNGIKIIGEAAFKDNYILKSVIVPDSVVCIEDDAFNACTAMRSINIPFGVTEIGSWAFADCKALREVVLPEGLISIGNLAFYSCISLTSVTIPASVTSMGTELFDDCDSVTVTVPRDSYAKRYCEENGVKYVYSDANDWLNE